MLPGGVQRVKVMLLENQFINVFVVHCQIHFPTMWILHIHVVKYVDNERRTLIQSLMTVIISVHCYVIPVLVHNV